MNIFSNVHGLTWIGAAFILIGTLLTIWGQQIISNKSNKEISNKQEQIVNLSMKNADLSNEITLVLIKKSDFEQDHLPIRFMGQFEAVGT